MNRALRNTLWWLTTACLLACGLVSARPAAAGVADLKPAARAHHGSERMKNQRPPGASGSGEASMKGNAGELLRGDSRKQSGNKESLPEMYLHLILRIKKDASFKIQKATELPGQPVLRDTPISDIIYEVVLDGNTAAVAFLAEDPFTVRGFSSPLDSKGEMLDESNSALIAISVPNVNISMLESRPIGLRLYRIKSRLTDKITPQVLKGLKDEGLVDLQVELPSKKLTKAIRKELARSKR